jgi:hypothetical protein
VYDGIVLGEKGYVYMVDFNVTGSDAGTSDKPKFLLIDFFERAERRSYTWRKSLHVGVVCQVKTGPKEAGDQHFT